LFTKGNVKEAYVLLDLAKIDRYQFPIEIYNGFLRILLQRQLLKDVEVLFEKIQQLSKPNQETYHFAIKAFLELQLFSRARKLLNEMNQNKIFPNQTIYSDFVRGFVSSGKLDEALDMLNKIPSEFALESYVVLLEVFVQQKDLNRVDEVIAKMSKLKLVSSLGLHNAVIGLYANTGNMTKATELFDQMPKLNLTPNIMTYNALLAPLCLHRSNKLIVQELLDKMQRNNVIPNYSTYSHLIRLCLLEDDLDLCLEYLGEMKSSGISNCLPTYEYLISYLINNQQHDHARNLLVDLEHEIKVRPTRNVFVVAMKACLLLHDFSRGLELYDELCKLRITLDSSGFNVALQIFARSSRFPDTESVFEKMKSLSIKPNLESFNSVLLATCRAKSLKQAITYFNEITKAGLAPNEESINTLIRTYLACGQENEARAFAQLMDVVFDPNQFKDD